MPLSASRFANLGTTLSTTGSLDVALTDRLSVVGEFGMLPQASCRDASEIAPPLAAPRTRAPHSPTVRQGQPHSTQQHTIEPGVSFFRMGWPDLCSRHGRHAS
jgi:hypothetical protein